MARPLRIDYPDTYYHVLSRGNERRPIFKADADYEMFLQLLQKAAEKFRLEIHAYVLMKNHYHLLVKTGRGNLSRALQWLGVTYAGWFNRTHRRSGHLFQGRFKSFLIENERYFRAMCYYIHGNPVRAGIVKNAEQYRWSSARAYAGKDATAAWLTTELMLSMVGGSRKRFCREQRQYLAERISPLSDLRHGLYLGSEEYGDVCAERVKGEGSPEKPQMRRLLRRQSPEQRAREVLRLFGERDAESQFVPTTKRRPLRDLSIYVLSMLGAYTHREIAEVFHIGYPAVSNSIRRAAAEMERNKRHKNMVDRVLKRIT